MSLSGSIRALLVEQHKYDLGCPTEQKCSLYKNHGQEKACEGCPKKLKISAPELDIDVLPRIKYLLRIEGMVNVGCNFGPDDLSPETWDELIVLHRERNKVRDQIAEQRKRANEEHPNLGPEAQKLIAEQRRELGIPPPGVPILPKPR